MDEACPECRAGKHGNCNGDTWNDDLDRPDVCPCFDAGHPDAYRACPWCSDRVAAEDLDGHLMDEHNAAPVVIQRGRRDRFDPEGEEADRESDRLDRLHERSLP